jgi:prepilin-type processing-associated H-X9-DG protein
MILRLMKTNKTHAVEITKPRNGFLNGCRYLKLCGLTLVELIAVISVILVLAAIIIPSAQSVLKSAHRTKDANQLRQIALAVAQFSQEYPNIAFKAKTPYEWTAQLAYYTGLYSASLYYVDGDPALVHRTLAVSLLSDTYNPNSISDEFKSAPLSFAFASSIPTHAPASTTPVAWTRGLREDGTWDRKTSPYQGNGGHIAFLDGHVVWYKRLDKNEPSMRLVKFGSSEATSNIKEALPPNVEILETSVF